jgi:hypothetical protein
MTYEGSHSAKASRIFAVVISATTQPLETEVALAAIFAFPPLMSLLKIASSATILLGLMAVHLMLGYLSETLAQRHSVTAEYSAITRTEKAADSTSMFGT